MALNGDVIWEVRTAGNSANGGGFKLGATGTDYSQQDAAQYDLTGLTSAGAGAIILTANAAAVMVGNIINITAGTNFTAGRYEITSVSVGVSITVDRNCTTGIGANGAGKVGGAIDHPQTIAGVVVAGNVVYIDNGTYSAVGANEYVFATGAAGTQYHPICWVGYNTARTTKPTGTDRPVFDANVGTAKTNVITIGHDYNTFCNLILRDASAIGVTGSGAYISCFVNCRITNNGGQGITRNNSTGMSTFLFDCEIDTNSAAATYASNSLLYAIHCYIHDNSGSGIFSRYGLDGAFPCLITIGCIIETNTGSGIDTGDDGGTSSYIIMNNVVNNNTGATSDGMQIGSSNGAYRQDFLSVLINNISSNNGRYGLNSLNTFIYQPVFDYNCTYGNATSGLNVFPSSTNHVTGNPAFTDAANGDFSLGAGSSCIDTGYPQNSMSGATV